MCLKGTSKKRATKNYNSYNNSIIQTNNSLVYYINRLELNKSIKHIGAFTLIIIIIRNNIILCYCTSAFQRDNEQNNMNHINGDCTTPLEPAPATKKSSTANVHVDT